MSSRVLQGLAWLVRQTFRTMSNSGSQTISLTTSTIGEEVRTTSPPAPRQSGGSSDKPSTKGVDLTENDCRTALTQDGLSNGTDDDIEFLKSALIGQDQPKGLSLRKFGAALTADEIRGLGYRANLVLSHECLAILTPKGRSDSAESAQFIVSAVTSRAAKRRDILRQIDALGPGTMVRILTPWHPGHVRLASR